MKKSSRRILRGGTSFLLSLTTLWAAAHAAGAEDLSSAARMLGESLPAALLRFERAGFFPDTSFSLPAALTLSMTPQLLTANAVPRETAPAPSPEAARPAHHAHDASQTPADEPVSVQKPPDGAQAAGRDNGVPSTTLRPSDPAGFLVFQNVYVRNGSSAQLTADDLGIDVPLRLSEEKPQVLIIHTHGCEAYTMPPGEEYVESDDHRTL